MRPEFLPIATTPIPEWEWHPIGRPRTRTCPNTVEYCCCGRAMVATREKETCANRRTGEFEFRVWHSCPRYFMSIWRNLLTLGTGGMGHQSHWASAPLVEREWR